MIKINNKQKKKASFTIVVVVFIILILGFVILMYFLWKFNSNDEVDRQLCHQSVVFRATLPDAAESLIPLKCKTEKICITAGLLGGKCEDTYGIDKSIVIMKVKTTEDIQKIFADEMANCWGMMGEGKLSLFSQYIAKTYGFGKIYPTCVICSQIAFDSESLIKAKIITTPEDIAQINGDAVGDYMDSTNIPGTEITYTNYLSNGNGLSTSKITAEDAFSALKTNILELQKDIDNANKNSENNVVETANTITDEEKQDITEAQISSEETKSSTQAAVLYMQISSPNQWGSLRNVVTTATGAAFGTSLMLKGPTGPLKLVSATGKFAINNPITSAILAIVGVGTQQGLTAWNRHRAAVYCGTITGPSGNSRDGCSALKVVDYNVEGIKDTCSIIESTP